ncbi:MAG TPA: response regulator [Candidatus Eisenbacteria bacterium]|nr:response regulator [Candidatus Eisenbacteria bacterium]
MRAIIIDDSRAMRAVLGRILAELGFEVFEADNGREALERLHEIGCTDLALVDWNMPEMNGFEFVQAVRAEREFDALRLVMVTTETEMTRVVKALGAGVDAYIMKPFAKAAVVEQLKQIGLLSAA